MPRCPACGGVLRVVGFEPAEARAVAISIRVEVRMRVERAGLIRWRASRSRGGFGVRAGVGNGGLRGGPGVGRGRLGVERGRWGGSRTCVGGAWRADSGRMSVGRLIGGEAISQRRGSASRRPGVLNPDWRSGFADSNPSQLGG